jgi:hypothetical protein
MLALLLQVAFDWHLQEIYDSVRPTIELVVTALLGSILLKVRKISHLQDSTSANIVEIKENARRLTNGNSVHHDNDPRDRPNLPLLGEEKTDGTSA